MKLTKQDFDMIKEAIEVYINNRLKVTAEILSHSKDYSNATNTFIDMYMKSNCESLKKWLELQEKLR